MSKCIDPEIGKLIGLYELQQLSKKEIKKFEAHLLECEACFQKVYELLPTAEVLRKHRKEFQISVQSEKISQKINFFNKPARYALAFAMLLCLFILPKPFRENIAYLSEINPVPYRGIRLKGDYQKTAFDHGIIAFERGDYKTAIDSLTLSVAQDSGNVYALLYCGLSYALKDTIMPESSDLKKAVFYLERTIEHSSAAVSESMISEGQWILANVYLKLNSIDEAKAELRLLTEKDSDYQRISKMTLNNLKHVRRLSILQIMLEKIKKG
ncbi:zf-HC2 domain-containing protein [bacterium]|nr:zf-HC2 domain-containing protein [bacterium]RQV97921.1 MAG: hypothetical protein EH221_02905 [bacterium]